MSRLITFPEEVAADLLQAAIKAGTMTSFNNKSEFDSKTEWLTPPIILKALGEFDLDPCAPVKSPWRIARKHLTIRDNGLNHKWQGRVFLNPPYTAHTWKWIKKLAEHGNGIALVFARTETKIFHPYVFEMADGIFFFDTRITFYHVTGELSEMNSGAPSVLIAYGKSNAKVLDKSGLPGKFFYLK